METDPSQLPIALSRMVPARQSSLSLRFVTLLSLLLPVLPALAQPPPLSKPEEGVEELMALLEEESVTIAARHEQPISQAPSNVYVITDEDIRQSGAVDLPTVLRRIPGMEVMQVTGADFNVSVRGDNQLVANKLLVMVDGRSIFVDVQAQVYWKAIPVTLPEIKRIEVLKGPASVLYGFNAFDGIINIITKSTEEMKGATAQFGGGAYGTISSAAIYANAHKKFRYRLSYGHDQNQQWRNGNSLAFRDDKFNVQTEYLLPGESKLSLSGGLVDVNRFDGNVVDAAVETGAPALSYAHAMYERPNFFIRAFWNGYYIDGPIIVNPVLAPFLALTDRNLSSNSTVRGNTYNVEAQHAFQIADSNLLTYGINYRLNTLSHNFINRYSTENRLGVYVQDEWKLHPLFSVVAGIRYDLDTFINPTVSPRVSLLFAPVPDHTLRATVAVGYRPPTLFETHEDNLLVLTFPPPIPSPPPVPVQGSEGLKPEKIVSYELSYQGWFLKHRLRVRTAAFFNHISDLITFGGPGPVQAGGVADIYGGEAGIEFLATKWLTGFANHSYQEIGQSLIGTAQRAGPRFKYNAGLRGEWNNGLSGEIAWHYYGAATYPLTPAFSNFAAFGVVPPNPRVGSYNLLNLRGGYRFWRQKARAGYMREAEVAISAFNVLNDKHKEHPLGDTIGSRVMGWLTLKF
jgi:iron complex outermembrane receptor protein